VATLDEDKKKSVSVSVTGGPTVGIPWSTGMNAQKALELAYEKISSTERFTYALQYYGKSLGYLVVMINETYDTFTSTSHPFFYWEFLHNEAPATKGIDGTVLKAGDRVAFSFERFEAASHQNSTLRAKYEFQQRTAGNQ
jgi:uncharacterized protein DUF4430